MDAIQFLINEVQRIIITANAAHMIEYDVQVASGSFPLFSMTSVYQGIQNFIVKVSPANRITHACLLLNSHFDSVPGSFGAGDDTIMVSVMLEVLRVLTQTEYPFEHDIVFLFNGAEENALQGSHPFITQHKWAQNVSAFINLDSAGAAGQDMLFQVTPNSPWLMSYYKSTARHPFATALGEEMFHANLIPSDTDFRIFRDYGKLSGNRIRKLNLISNIENSFFYVVYLGVDLALGKNGYVYHTKYDKPEIIPLETYQNVGDNVLALSRALAIAYELNAPNVSLYLHSLELGFNLIKWLSVQLIQ